MSDVIGMNDLEIPDTLHRESLVFDLLDNTNYAPWRKNMHILFMRMSLLYLIDYDRPHDSNAASGKKRFASRASRRMGRLRCPGYKL